MSQISEETKQRLLGMVATKPEFSFLEQQQLLSKLRQLSKYFNFEIIDQLASIIMLEESIFKVKDFGEEFGQSPFFWEIARYNIYNRSLKLLKEKSKRKFTSSYEFGNFRIFYTNSNGHRIETFKAVLKKFNPYTEEIVRPTIALYHPDPVEEQLDDLDKKMSIAGFLRNTYKVQNPIEVAKIRSQYNIPYSFGGPEVWWEKEYQETIDKLQKEKEFLKQYGALEREVCHEVGDILLHDWDMELEESLETEGKVKELSWIDVYQYHNRGL